MRGTDVFIIQSHAGTDDRSINDSIMEQLVMIDAAYRASAKRITAVCPFYGYARQDRKGEGREPITARLVADMFKAAGAKRMISLDLHSGQIQGFFDGPVDHLTAMPVLEDYLRRNSTDPVIVSPDAGRIKVAERTSQHLSADLAFVYKRRPKGSTNVAEARDVIGEVDGRQCVLIDDMIDTASTIVAAADILYARGASEVWAMATHGVLSGPAIDRLKNSEVRRLVITNTLPLPSEKQLAQDRGAVGGARSSPPPSTPSSRTPRSRRSSAARTKPERRRRRARLRSPLLRVASLHSACSASGDALRRRRRQLRGGWRRSPEAVGLLFGPVRVRADPVDVKGSTPCLKSPSSPTPAAPPGPARPSGCGPRRRSRAWSTGRASRPSRSPSTAVSCATRSPVRPGSTPSST